MMGLHWFRQRIDMDKNYRGKRSLSAEQSAKPSMKVTANDSNFRMVA